MPRQTLVRCILGLLVFAAPSGRVLAHGLVKIDYIDNKIHIASGDNGLVFWDANEGPYIQFDFASDGIENIASQSAGGHLVAGDVISLQVMGPLLYDSGSGLGLSSPGTTSVQIQPINKTVTGTTGELDAAPWATVLTKRLMHQHYNFYFSNALPGVYGIEFRLLSSNLSIAPSDSYLLLFDNGIQEEDMPSIIDNFETVLAPKLLGDLNLDGFVGQDDLNIILGLWGQHVPVPTVGDINTDGFVGQDDLNTVLSEWGQGTLPTFASRTDFQSVPETSSLLMTSATCLGILVWQRMRKSSATPTS